jgi:hypothetical protein
MGKLLLTSLPLVLHGSNNPLIPPVDGLLQLLDATVEVPIPGLVFPLDGFGRCVGVNADGHQFRGSVWSKINTIVMFRIPPSSISKYCSRLLVHLALVPLHHDAAGSREPIFESRGGYLWAPMCTVHGWSNDHARHWDDKPGELHAAR